MRGRGIPEDEEAGELATKVVPLTDHIVLQPIDGDEVTVTGLVIPDSAKEKPQQGDVVAVGPGKMNDAGVVETIDLSAGDRVLYQMYAGTKVEIDKTDYIVVRFGDVLAKLDLDSPKKAKKR
jgi:chaperonin GroES